MYITQCIMYITQCVMKFSVGRQPFCDGAFLILNMCIIKEILLYLHIGIMCIN